MSDERNRPLSLVPTGFVQKVTVKLGKMLVQRSPQHFTRLHMIPVSRALFLRKNGLSIPDYRKTTSFVEMEELRQVAEMRPDLKIYVLLDYPWTEEENGHQGDFDPMRHLPRWRPVKNIILPYPQNDAWKQGNDFIVNGLKGYVTFIDPQNYICPGKKCDILTWYRDDDHLQPKRLKSHGVWLDPVFE